MKKKWIQAMHMKKGALRKSLGIKSDKTIPISVLNKAEDKGGVIGKRATLAKTLLSFNKKK